MNSRQETLIEQDTPRTPAPGVGWEEFSRELVEFFASIKLAMFLFLFIAITATIGTVIQQGERPETYIQEYGEECLPLVSSSGLHRRLSHLVVYQSARAPLRQFAHVFLQAVSGRLAVDETGQGQRVACLHQGDEAADRSDRCPAPRNRSPSRWHSTTSRKAIACSPRMRRGEVTLYATKGVMGRVGAHMAHLSATVIVLGGLLGSYYGFQEFGVCLEGQTYHIPRGNFDLKVDKFWIDYHENGAVKVYNSTLTVLEGGQSKMTKTITVNDPLVYKGIWFYQSSYGDAWDQIEVARVNIKDKADREGRQDHRSGVAKGANARRI